MRVVLKKLAALFALVTIEREMGDFLEDGYFSRAQVACCCLVARTRSRAMAQAVAVRKEVRRLLSDLRPEGKAVACVGCSALKGARATAVALVDAFGMPDFQLQSALGRYDGDCYQVGRYNHDQFWCYGMLCQGYV